MAEDSECLTLHKNWPERIDGDDYEVFGVKYNVIGLSMLQKRYTYMSIDE